MSAYVKSKPIAERAAWDFIKAEGGALELAVINPAGIFGPVLGPDSSSSTLMVKRLLTGMPGCPRIHFAVVDVRDVADLHLRAMASPAANGERFIAVAENGGAMSMLEMATVLKARLGAAAKKVPTRELPDWIVRAGASSIPPCASCCRCSARFATRPAQRRGACSPGSRARARTRWSRRRRVSWHSESCRRKTFFAVVTIGPCGHRDRVDACVRGGEKCETNSWPRLSSPARC